MLNTPERLASLKKVYNSMPRYHFLSEPQKNKFFKQVTNKFQTNLQQEKIKGCSHSKKVIFNHGNKTKGKKAGGRLSAMNKLYHLASLTDNLAFD